ncbi:MAG: VanZ family protein [Candidatus Saccharicenans sp.]|nr:VanZ family protein [Candidatus Saccharicenans sp.]
MKFMKRWLYFAPALLYCGLIFFLSGQGLKLRFGLVFWDKGAHLLEFAGLGFLLALGFFNNLPGLSFLSAYLTFMAGISVGLLDELHQSFVPGRQCDWKDWVADVIGVLGGLLAYRLLFHNKKKSAENYCSGS